MSAVPYLALISAVAGLALAGFYYKAVEAAPPGNDRMVFLMTEIQKGARAFLKQEYTWVAAFAAVMLILIAIVITPLASVAYIIGAILSAAARRRQLRPLPLPAGATSVGRCYVASPSKNTCTCV